MADLGRRDFHKQLSSKTTTKADTNTGATDDEKRLCGRETPSNRSPMEPSLRDIHVDTVTSSCNLDSFSGISCSLHSGWGRDTLPSLSKVLLG